MDTITHALIGAVAARATAPGNSSSAHMPIRTRTLIGALAAAFPDIDYITYWISPLSYITDWHRAVTHSFLMLPVWALILGLLIALLSKRKEQWREITAVCALGIFTHILADLITSWPTQIISPLSDFAPALSLTFIIDIYFTAIIVATLVISITKQSRLAARAGLLLLVSYIGLQAILKQQAVAIGNEFVQAKGLYVDDVYAMPQPFSPFNWKLIVTEGKHYYVAYLNLLAREPATLPTGDSENLWNITSYYRPEKDMVWQQYSLYGEESVVEKVWMRPEFDRYRRFARNPALYRIDKSETELCVWFMDLHFVLPIRKAPFVYGMCKQEQGDWELYHLVDETPVAVER